MKYAAAYPARRFSPRTTLVALAVIATLGPAAPATAGEYTINACGADPGNYSTQAFEDFATRGMLDRTDQVLLVTTPDESAARLAVDALQHLDHQRTTVVVNRTHPRLDPELRAIEEFLRHGGLDGSLVIPDDRRLALMLDTGTYTLEALDRPTRVAVKRLGAVIAERLV